MWSPAEPNRLGSLSTPAAKMTGRREQEREAGGILVVEPAPQPADHRDARAADAREQREDLQQADGEAVAVGDAGDAQVGRAAASTSSAERGRRRRAAAAAAALRRAPPPATPARGSAAPRRRRLLGAPARALAGEQDQAVDEQEDAGGERLGEDRPEGVLEREAR